MLDKSQKLLLLITLIIYLLLAINIPLINELSWIWNDYKTSLRNASQNIHYEQIAIVAIDDESLSQIPEKYPWNRRRLAQVIHQLKKHQSKLIILDDYIQSPSSIDPAQDEILASIFLNAKNVISRNYLRRFINHKGEKKLQIAPPIPIIKRSAKGLGFVDFQKDQFLRLRDLSLEVETANEKHSSLLLVILESLGYQT
ncbi:CHASE2 domain-containing protein, partial [bacterium]|nr:CHASE2 domain-containing protein [bacterium]